MTLLRSGRFVVGLLIVAAVGAACSDAEPQRSRLGNPISPQLSDVTIPSLSPDNPTVIGDGQNSVTPSGEGQVGIDATDSICRELKRDLDKSITETLKELRDAGMSSEFMPTRSDLKKQLSGALRANGCSSF